MTEVLIKKGYQLVVDSWENDGDHSQQISKDGLSYDDAKFLVKLLEFVNYYYGNCCSREQINTSEFEAEFAARDKGQEEEYLANLQDVFYRNLLSEVVGVAYLPPLARGLLNQSRDDTEDAVFELYREYTGYSEHFLARKVESIKVYYHESDVIAEDITGEFLWLK